MARNTSVVLGGTLILDCEGLSRLIARDREVMRILADGTDAGYDRVIAAPTLLEASHGKINRSRWNFVLSQLRIEPLTVELAKEAAELLQRTDLHGHKYAIDAMVAVTAMRQPGPVVLLTSDIDDMSKLCGKRIELVGL